MAIIIFWKPFSTTCHFNISDVTMITLQAERLERLGRAMLEAAGSPEETAGLVASMLVKANLLGHDSHGIRRLLLYIQQIRDGKLKPRAVPSVQQSHGAALVVDAAWGFGQVAGVFAAKHAIEIAKQYGMASIALANANHTGRLGDFVEMIAQQGCIAMMMTSGGAPNSNVAAFGGRDGIFGTNPFAWAAPRRAPNMPIIVDYATSSVAAGKLDVAISKGAQVSEGLLLDAEGRPTTDPASYLDGGVMLPFGGHKGYGMMLMVETMGRLLAGGALVSDSGYHREPGSWTFISAWHIEAFVRMEQYYNQIEALAGKIHQSRPAQTGDAVMLPGDPELHTLELRRMEGIPMPEATWSELLSLADSLGVSSNLTNIESDAGVD